MKLIATMLAFGAIMLPASASAQQPPKPLFAATEPLHLVIQAPIAALMRNRGSNAAVQGTMTDPSGVQLAVALSPRGITRRSRQTCDFAPLKVQFTTPPPATSVFAGQKKLKLVTHCRNAPSFQQYVLLEYAAYRMYNALTPHSFDVRLANIDYRDADGRPLVSRVGYFIEDLGDVAKRNGLKQTHAPSRISSGNLNPTDAARYALFQHLVANHDWSITAGPAGSDCCHNGELIGPLGSGSAIPIPYDFDFSGFVNAPYAVPPDVLRIESVKQRAYRGYCMHNAQVLAVAREMRERRPQLLAILASTPGLEERTQKRAAAFLDGFFADIASDQAVAGRLLNRCVG